MQQLFVFDISLETNTAITTQNAQPYAQIGVSDCPNSFLAVDIRNHLAIRNNRDASPTF